MAALRSTRLTASGQIFKGSNDVRHIIATAGVSAAAVILKDGTDASAPTFLTIDIAPEKTVAIDFTANFVRFPRGCFLDFDANLIGCTVIYG